MVTNFYQHIKEIYLKNTKFKCYREIFKDYDAFKLIDKPLNISINKIFTRVLILEIHTKKDEGKLQGNTPEEQYAYYTDILLNDETYINTLFAKYPELRRLITLEINNVCSMLTEIMEGLETDKEQITKMFCGNRSFNKIVDLDLAAGDCHNGGRSAAKIQLDNGTVLYYKPHSLQKNVKYQKVYHYLCQKAGISSRTVQYLSHDTYGWEENIENKGCNTEEEIERYYFRMGIHLFIGYALSATDLHGENIIAHGEYPVIIDMETFPGYFIRTEESSAERKIETMLAGSVIHTGMLPVLTWGQGSRTVVMSAMNYGTKITTPFHMPVVKFETNK